MIAAIFAGSDVPFYLLAIFVVLWFILGPVAFGVLRSRITRLERRLAALEGNGPGPVAARPAAMPATTMDAGAAVPSPPPPATPGPDWENLLAGHWLNRIGILAMVFGVAFFLRYAFQSGWVGPTGRVLIGLVAGVLLLAWSVRLDRAGYRYFSDGIAGLGTAVLYLALYAAWNFYHLVAQPLAFSGMVLVTAWLAQWAWRRQSRGLILLAYISGLLIPALLSTGTDQHLALFSFLAVLNAAFLALSERLQWQPPQRLGWAATQIYFWYWYERFYHHGLLGITLGFGLIFFALFLSPLAWAVLGRLKSGRRIPLAIADTVFLLVILTVLLWPDHRWPLTLLTLAVAAGLCALVLKAGERAWTAERTALAGLALALVTVAVPYRLDGNWIPVAWSLEALALVAGGFRWRLSGLRRAGLVVFAAAGFRLLFMTAALPVHQLLLNRRFATFAVAVACMLAARWRAQRDGLTGRERTEFAVLEAGLHVFALVALSLEVWDALHRAGARGLVDIRLAPQLGLSLLWTVYASGLMLLGVRGQRRLLRWQALALFALVIAKVFLYDLSFLSSGYRILSFLVLGALLLGVSFLYQRRFSGNGPAGGGAS